MVPDNLRPNPQGDRPQVDPTACVDPTARLIGRVRVGPRAFVGPGAVLRADEAGPGGAVEAVDIGAECNVQDGVIIHALGGSGVTVGPRTSLAHGCVVHGPCMVGEGCFVGFRAVVFKAVLEAGVMVGAAAVVQGVTLKAGALVPPGRVVVSSEQTWALGMAGDAERHFMAEVVETNLALADGYRAQGGAGGAAGAGADAADGVDAGGGP